MSRPPLPPARRFIKRKNVILVQVIFCDQQGQCTVVPKPSDSYVVFFLFPQGAAELTQSNL